MWVNEMGGGFLTNQWKLQVLKWKVVLISNLDTYTMNMYKATLKTKRRDREWRSYHAISRSPMDWLLLLQFDKNSTKSSMAMVYSD